jgi:hypothetical protein
MRYIVAMKRFWAALFLLALISSAVVSAKTTNKPKRVNPLCSSAHLTWLSQAELDRQTTLMQQAGIQWVRSDFAWFDMEPSPSVHMFSEYDRIVTTASAHGLRVIALVTQYGIPPFYRQDRTNWMSPPADPQDYKRFAQALATHFRGRIQLYELGNEPDLDWAWPPAANVAAFSALLKAGYQGIKAGDPRAKVISAGLSNVNPEPFLQGMYDNGVKGYFDYFGFHSYSWPRSADDTVNATPFGRLATLRQLMLNNGDNKQIMVTEVGWPTFSGGVDEQTQATYINRIYQKVEYEDYTDVPIACIYDFVDDGTDMTNAEDNFGLLRFDYTAKPSYAAMSAVRADFNAHFTPMNP